MESPRPQGFPGTFSGVRTLSNMSIEAAPAPERTGPTDEETVARVLAGETALFETLMRRYNQRVYRVVLSVVANPGEAEDVTHDAWVRAFEHLAQFAGRARFSTWLTRIAVHEALARRRRLGRHVPIEDSMETLRSPTASPEQRVADHELGAVIEAAFAVLPQVYRSVFMLREVEGLSTVETAACLELNEETVKTRLHRARALLRNQITARIGMSAKEAFRFAGARCDGTVAAVMARIQRG